MNFFMIGFAASLLHLNTSWITAYIVKAVGMFFMLGGIAEMKAFTEDFSPLRGRCIRALIVCIAAGAGLAVVKFAVKTETAVDIASIAAGTLSSLFCLGFGKEMLALLDKKQGLVSDRFNIEDINKWFGRIMKFTAVCLVSDAPYRISEESTPGALFG